MRKLWFYVLVLAAVLLSACGQQVTPALTSAAVAPTEDVLKVKMECTVVSFLPTPGPTVVSLFPPISAEDWVMGSETPVLTITEYSDFQCPYCAQFSAVLHELVQKHPDEIRAVYRYFPLTGHPLALAGAYAAEAAGRQGHFWEMEEVIYAKQADWAAFSEPQFVEWLVNEAQSLGLNTNQFTQDMQSQSVIEKVQLSQQYAMSIQIPGTPFVLINGQPYNGPRDTVSLEAILQLLRLEERQVTYCPPMEIDPDKQYIATLKTAKGDIRIQLFADKAPMAVNSFVFLARNGWFDSNTFFRVQSNSVAQTGDPSGTGYGGPGYTFDNEISNLKFDKEGLLGLANAGPGSNGSQFFITYAPQPSLDGNYTIFGEVIEGMDVVKKLTPRDPDQGGDLPPGDVLETISIEEK